MLALLGLTYVDFSVTYDAVRQFGPRAELNPAHRWLLEKLGVGGGFAAIFAGQALLLSLLGWFGLAKLLYVLLGAKATMAALQLKRILFL